MLSPSGVRSPVSSRGVGEESSARRHHVRNCSRFGPKTVAHTLMMHNKLLWFIQDLLILTKSVLPVKQMVVMHIENGWRHARSLYIAKYNGKRTKCKQ